MMFFFSDQRRRKLGNRHRSMSPPSEDHDHSDPSSASRARNLRSRSHRKDHPGESSAESSLLSPRAHQHQLNGGGGGGGGASSAASNSASPSILPTTSPPDGPFGSASTPGYFPSSSSATRRQPSAAPYNNTCNSFLLGGSYYPGKDKKRRHIRKKALWYRVFCSTPWRLASSIIALAYIAVWHILLPFASLMLYYGGLLSSSSTYPGRVDGALGVKQREHGEEWLLNHYRLPFTLPMLDDERSVIHDLVEKRRSLQPQHNEARRQILQRIVPLFYHRNEKHSQTKDEGGANSGSIKLSDDRGKDKDRHVERQDNRMAKEKIKSKDGSNNHEQQLQQQEDLHLPAGNNVQYHVPSVSRPIRTLQNMDTYPNDSQCPALKGGDKKDIRISLVIQASVDRLWVLNETCRRWGDPIVAVVGLSVDEQSHNDARAAALAGWEDKCPQLKLIVHKLDEEQAKPEMYPVNRLRNIALESVETSHILVVDVDFVPSDQLARTIRASLKERQQLREQADERGIKVPSAERDALVVPAFERVVDPPCSTDDECKHYLMESSSFIPKSFDDLRSCVGSKECIVFQSNVNWEGHYSTRSEGWLRGDWYEQNELQDLQLPDDVEKPARIMKSVKCFDSLRYEPYVVLAWCGDIGGEEKGQRNDERQKPAAPFYDERFHGYGKNKIEYISHIRLMGYQFSILPEGFIVHNPHIESKAKEVWNDVKASDLHADMDRLYPQFLHELVDKYDPKDVNSIVQPCPREESKRR